MLTSITWLRCVRRAVTLLLPCPSCPLHTPPPAGRVPAWNAEVWRLASSPCSLTQPFARIRVGAWTFTQHQDRTARGSFCCSNRPSCGPRGPSTRPRQYRCFFVSIFVAHLKIMCLTICPPVSQRGSCDAGVVTPGEPLSWGPPQEGHTWAMAETGRAASLLMELYFWLASSHLYEV